MKILIVDDNQDLADNIQDILNINNYAASSVYDGSSAIELCHRESFDLVLLDYKLPDMDGLQLQERLSEFSDADFIIITGYASIENAAEAVKQKHIVGYETKPLDIRRLLSFIHQVENRRQAEMIINRQNLHMQIAQQMAKIGYWSFDIATGMPDWSDMMFTVLGCDPEKGIPHYDEHRNFIHPDDWDAFDRAVQGAAAGTPYHIELRIIFPDQSIHYVMAQGYPLFDAGGKIISLFGTTQDITDRKQAEGRLRKSEERLRIALDAVNAGIWYLNIQNGDIFIDDKFCDMLGYAADEIPPKLDESLHHPDDWNMIVQKLEQLISGETTVYNNEYRVLTKSKAWKWIHAWAKISEWDENRNPIQLTGAAIDIDERKQYEEKIRASLKEKEVLLREVHHRVKNNLMVVKSLIQMQAEQTKEPAALQLFHDLHNRVMAMTMVHECLYQSENLAEIDFALYLNNLMFGIRQGFGRTSVMVKVTAENIFLDVDKSIPCGLIVAELVTNAFKYAFPPQNSTTSLPLKENPEIRVEIHKTENIYTLIVSDNGVGLPPEFDLKSIRTLGLNLVKSWATHQMRGTLNVECREGTRFETTFSV